MGRDEAEGLPTDLCVHGEPAAADPERSAEKRDGGRRGVVGGERAADAVQVVAASLLQRVGNPPVQQPAPRRAQLCVGGFAQLVVAEAVGFLGIRIEDPAGVRSGLQRMLAHPGPVVVDVMTDANALSLPPHIEFDQVKGYALSMTKLMLSGRADEVVDIIQSNIRDI